MERDKSERDKISLFVLATLSCAFYAQNEIFKLREKKKGKRPPFLFRSPENFSSADVIVSIL